MVQKPNGDFNFENGKFVHNVKCSNKFKYFAVSILTAFFLVSHQPATAEYEESKLAKYVNYIKTANKTLTTENAIEIASALLKWSEHHDVPADTMFAVAKIESRFNHMAKSPTGSVGLMQIQQRWHRDTIKKAKSIIGDYSINDININAYVGGYVIKACMSKFKLTDMALRCYNGSTNVKTDYHIKVNREIRNLSV